MVQQVPQDLLPQAYGLPVVRQQAEGEIQGFPRAEAGKEQLAQARQLQVLRGEGGQGAIGRGA